MAIGKTAEPKLYTYFRSSASYRVRIALNLKGLAYNSVPIHLLREGGEHLQDSFRELNPHALVPVYMEDGQILRQSLAILEYLEERYPEIPLLPQEPAIRAQVRALALDVACEIHPLANLRVQRYLVQRLHIDAAAKSEWARHWIAEGLGAIETTLHQLGRRGRFIFGDEPTFAECCLIPQLFNAHRAGVEVQTYPVLASVEKACLTHPAFQAASPAEQIDAELPVPP